MIGVNLWNQHYRRYLIHISIVLAFLVYLVSANYIFCCVLTVDGEAGIYEIDVPAETGDVRYAIDSIETRKIDWKDMVVVNGWAFIEGTDAHNCSTHIVLKTGTEEVIFSTRMWTRPDVTQAFSAMQLDLNESGFYSNIPLERIPDGTHQIGIIISKDDADRTSYALKNTYIVKKGKNVELKKRS